VVTYRESALLVSNVSKEAMTEQGVVTTVAHELAHQWFGDIVTMAWWNDLWLNEGFASFVEFIGMSAYAGGSTVWDTPGQLILGTQTSALALDSSQYSHPIIQTVNDPAEIESLFDSISYDKGSSIILMVAGVLGFSLDAPEIAPASDFQIGLGNYIKAHSYGNAASADLWAALQASAPANLPVTIPELMDLYTNQMGYPVLTLTVDGTDPTMLVVKQGRFLILPYDLQDPALRDGQGKLKWDVNIQYATAAGGAIANQWMKSTDASVNLPMGTSTWLLANAGRYGYYRVNYPGPIWHQLALQLQGNNALWSTGDRVGLIDDVWTLALAGQTTYAAAFDIVQFLGMNQFAQYTPWAAAAAQFSEMSFLTSSQPDLHAKFNRYVLSLIGNNTLAMPPWSPIVAPGDTHLASLLQQLFVSSLVAYNDTSARGVAWTMWQDFRTSGTPVPVDIRNAVYQVGIEQGTAADWTFLFGVYSTTLDSGEAKRILRALARSRDTAQLNVMLDYAQNGQIKSQDQARVIEYVAMNSVGSQVAWDWIKGQWSKQALKVK
jgi:aminopeptidase N